MSAEAVRSLVLRVVHEDAASVPLKQFHAQEEARIKKTASEQDKADQAYIRAIKTKLAAEKQLEAEITRRIKDREAQENKSEQAYVRAVRKKLAAEKEIDREKERALRKQERDQDRADQAYVRSVYKKLAAEKQLEEKVNASLHSQTAGILKMVAAFAGIQSVQGIVTAFADHFDRIRDDAFHAAEDVMKMRGAVRELQALRDQMGKTGAGVAHVIAASAETLQKPEELQQMELAAIGLGELAIGEGKGKTMTRADFEEFLKSAGKMQTMEGGSPEAWGQMAGLIALQSKDRMTPAQAEAKLQRMFEIQRPGAFQTMTQAIGQYQKLSGMVMNDVMTPEEAMGLVTAEATAGNKDEAGTHAQQLARAMLGGRLRARHIKLSEGVNAETTAEYMKDLGITEKHTVMERAAMVSADLAKNTGAGKENALEYLKRHGFGNEEEALAIMGYSGLKAAGKLGDIEKAQRADLREGAITERFGKFQQADPMARTRAVEAQGRIARTKVGLEEEPLVQAQEAAFNRLYEQRKIQGEFKDWRGRGMLGRMSDDVLFQGYHDQVNREVEAALFRERKRLGMPITGMPGQASEADLRRMAQEVQGAGGDVTGGAARGLKSAADKLIVAAERLDQATRDRPPPLAAPPNPPGRQP